MLRSAVGAGFLVCVCAFSVVAKEYKDIEVTTIDLEKGFVIAKVGGEDKMFVIDDKSDFISGKGEKYDKEKLADVAKKMKKGRKAAIETVEEDGKEVMKAIKDKDEKYPVLKSVKFAPRKKDAN